MPTTDHGGWKYGTHYGVTLPSPDAGRIDGTLVGVDHLSEYGGASGLWLRPFENPGAAAFYVALGPGSIVRKLGMDETYQQPWQEDGFEGP